MYQKMNNDSANKRAAACRKLTLSWEIQAQYQSLAHLHHSGAWGYPT